MEKIDVMADEYRGKSPREIPAAVLDSWCKSTEILENIATIEGMEQYGEQFEMSGAQRRSRRTGRFMRANAMNGQSFGDPMMAESYDTYYDRSGDMKERLEDMLDDPSISEREKEMARKLMAEMRKNGR